MTTEFHELRAYVTFNPRDNYLRTAMPSARDRKIAAIVTRLRTEADYLNAIGALTGMGETFLPVFAERMAVMTVREANVLHVLDGLRAILLAYAIENGRELVIPLALLWHSAGLVGAASGLAFDEVAGEAGRYGEPLRAFKRRIPSERSISAMGYSTSGHGDAFEYRCDW